KQTKPIVTSSDSSDAAIAARFVLPVAPKINATPYRKNAEENDPSKKYFRADSFDLRSVRRNPANTYVAIERISSPRKTITSSFEEDIMSIPAVANSRSAWNSE